VAWVLLGLRLVPGFIRIYVTAFPIRKRIRWRRVFRECHRFIRDQMCNLCSWNDIIKYSYNQPNPFPILWLNLVNHWKLQPKSSKELQY